MSKKNTVITFKADEDIMSALDAVENKSEFIRSAILAALNDTCPFCAGTGKLSPHQRKHWAVFARDHDLTPCKSCNGVLISCKHEHGEDEE